MDRSPRPSPRLVLAGLLATGALLPAVAGCSLGGGDDEPAAASSTSTPALSTTAPASSTAAPASAVTAPRTTTGPGPARQVAPAPTSAQRAAADVQARVKGLDTSNGSLTRLVAPGAATSGYALWQAQTARGIVNMILGPRDTGIAWAGCSREFAGTIDHCGSAQVPPATALMGGHVAPTVRSVDVIVRPGVRRAAEVGAGGWLYVGRVSDLGTPTSDGWPVGAEAFDAKGVLLARVPLAP